MKSVLYVTEPGLLVHQSGARILVKRGSTLMMEGRMEEIERVVICTGAAGLTTQAAAALMEAGIEVSLLSSSGGFRGYLSPAKSRGVTVRMAQYLAYSNESRRLELARTFVRQKIQNGERLLARFARNHTEFNPTRQRERMLRMLEAANRVASIESLLGYEGTAAAAYFEAFGQMLRQDFAFTVRSRRPPRDPANALLSLAYTLLTAEATSAVAGAGLDPALGMLHIPEDGRPALGLDLTEEFRQAVGDRLVLHLVNNRVLAASTDFELAGAEGGFRLTAPARKKFYAAYETRMTEPIAGETGRSLREWIRFQATGLARALVEGNEYHPFVLRG